MLQKTIFLLCQAYVQATSMTGHKIFDIWAIILAIMTPYSLLLELEPAGWDFSGYGWFKRLSCLPFYRWTIYYDHCFYQLELLLQQFWNSVTLCHHQVSCKQWHPWDLKAYSSKSDTCFYNWACKQLFFDPLYLHHLFHCCKTWWC